MTPKELKEIAESNIIAIRELREANVELRKSQEKTDEQMQKTDEQMQKTDEQMKKTDARLNRLCKRYGDSQRNKGELTEYEFEKTLKVIDLIVDGVKYDGIDTKVKAPHIAEFDVVLTNGTQILVIEVKDKAHKDDVKKFMEQLAKYTTAFPQYANHKIKGAIASKKITPLVKQELFKHNLLAIENVNGLTVQSA